MYKISHPQKAFIPSAERFSTPPHPPLQMVGGYGPLLYQIGMADTNQRNRIEELTDQIVKNIQNQQFLPARLVRTYSMYDSLRCLIFKTTLLIKISLFSNLVVAKS